MDPRIQRVALRKLRKVGSAEALVEDFIEDFGVFVARTGSVHLSIDADGGVDPRLRTAGRVGRRRRGLRSSACDGDTAARTSDEIADALVVRFIRR